MYPKDVSDFLWHACEFVQMCLISCPGIYAQQELTPRPSRMTQEESRGGGSAAGKIRRGDLGKESRAGEGMEGEERATEGEERAKACC
jgi:hypothetical protein